MFIKHGTSQDYFFKEITAILTTILFLLLGFISILIFKIKYNIEGDALYISLLLVPITAYLIISGKVSEFKAPGGLEAKFIDFSSKPVEFGIQKIGFIETQIITKGLAVAQVIRDKISELDESKPIILTLILGGGNYNRRAILEYVTNLFDYETFTFVVFLNKDKKFCAYIMPKRLQKLLENQVLGDLLVSYLNDGNISNLAEFPAIISKSLTTKTTWIEALKIMTEQNVDFLVVVDENKLLKGIVEKTHIMSKLLISLA